MGNGGLFVFCFVLFCFVLRTTSVSPLDRDKDTLSLTRKNANAFSAYGGVEIWWALSGSCFFVSCCARPAFRRWTATRTLCP